jgi:hypothetical protein
MILFVKCLSFSLLLLPSFLPPWHCPLAGGGTQVSVANQVEPPARGQCQRLAFLQFLVECYFLHILFCLPWQALCSGTAAQAVPVACVRSSNLQAAFGQPAAQRDPRTSCRFSSNRCLNRRSASEFEYIRRSGGSHAPFACWQPKL